MAGIPQSDTDQANATIPWVLGGQDHISTGVVKGGLPAVDGEDNKVWDVMKYEKQELTRTLYRDGVFEGNVWDDGVSRDSFKVSYSVPNLTVKAGRATVGTKRVDLGLTGTFDVDFINAFVLPAGGSEKIIYLDIFERDVTPTPAFPPAGQGYDISVYADFATYNVAASTIKEVEGVIPASLPAPAAGHTFMEIGRIDSAGVATDTRTLASLKLGGSANAQQANFVVNPLGDIGVNCTHTDLGDAITAANVLAGTAPVDQKITIYLFPMLHTLPNTTYTMADRIVMFSDIILHSGAPNDPGAKVDMSSGAKFEFGANSSFEVRNIEFETDTTEIIEATASPTTFKFQNVTVTITGTHDLVVIDGFSAGTFIEANNCSFDGRVQAGTGSKFTDCTFDFLGTVVTDVIVGGSGGLAMFFNSCQFTYGVAGTLTLDSIFNDCEFIPVGVVEVLRFDRLPTVHDCKFTANAFEINCGSGAASLGKFYSSNFKGVGTTPDLFEVTGASREAHFYDCIFDDVAIEIRALATGSRFIYNRCELLGLLSTPNFQILGSERVIVEIDGLTCVDRFIITNNGDDTELYITNILVKSATTSAFFQWRPATKGSVFEQIIIFDGIKTGITTVGGNVEIEIPDNLTMNTFKPFMFNNFQIMGDLDISTVEASTISRKFQFTALNVGRTILVAYANAINSTSFIFSGCDAQSFLEDAIVSTTCEILFSGCTFASLEAAFAAVFNDDGGGTNNRCHAHFAGCSFMSTLSRTIDVNGTVASSDYSVTFVGCRFVNKNTGGTIHTFDSAIDVNVASSFLTGPSGVALTGAVTGGGAIAARTLIGPATANNVEY